MFGASYLITQLNIPEDLNLEQYYFKREKT
jgi:hypothetical protein